MKLRTSLLSLAFTGLAAALANGQAIQGPPAPSAPPVPVEKIREKIDSVALAPQVSEVVKMSEAGVNEKTIVTYISTSPGFSLKANDVIALHDRGVSSELITAMLQHPAPTPVAQQTVTPPPPVTQATVAQTTTDNPPIIYPTPVTQPTLITSPEVVYTMPIYSAPSSVIIMGSSYYPRSYYGGYGYYGGFRSCGVGFRGYCGPSYRCRY